MSDQASPQIPELIAAKAAELVATAIPGEPVVATWETQERLRIAQHGSDLAKLLALLPPDVRVVNPEYVEKLATKAVEDPAAAKELAEVGKQVIQAYSAGEQRYVATVAASTMSQRVAAVVIGAVAMALAYYLVFRTRDVVQKVRTREVFRR